MGNYFCSGASLDIMSDSTNEHMDPSEVLHAFNAAMLEKKHLGELIDSVEVSVSKLELDRHRTRRKAPFAHQPKRNARFSHRHPRRKTSTALLRN